MSLNMYLGEVQSQTQSMNAICNTTIQSMEQAIQSIDAFAIDTVLQGQTYSSAKAYLVQTFRPLAQGIICLCEELIRQNEAFPNDFQAKVASTDVIEHEIRQQIQEINQSIASIEAIEVLTPMPGVDAIIAVLIAMRKKLEEKLERLYEFNHSSSNNYSTALQLAASITAGLAEVQSGKGFSPVSGTFHSEKLNMEWAKQIQIIIEEKIRKSDNGIGKSVDLEHNVYNDIEGISSENQSINNRFTKEEIQATQKYLEGIKNGTIKGNIGEDFQVETDDYEMEHNIFGQPVGGRRPVLDPFLIGVAKFGFDFLFGDLFTLFDPEATYGEKLLAVGMMTPYGKGVKIVDKLHDLKKVGDVKKATSGSAGVAKGTGNSKYTTKIKWGINDIEARPYGKGYWGKRIPQKNPRVDEFELKINPSDESFYLPHPKGGFVQFENLAGDVVQDGKLIIKQKSFYHVEEMPKFAQDKVIQEALRQIDAAKVAEYKVEWLVSEEKAVEQLKRLFKKMDIDIEVKYYPE
ncbi:T7SS effector LXG polymorphic toxin [Bacillus sp. RA(2023)]|uniref:T7SS effector LXG polymorphic toxin n=2 Tax=Bacillaceae TaxID=186817 RepID=UPI0009950DCE|nr:MULTISPECIES: T7SS effector LXG polymorphic toxin [Bacillus]MDC2941550.1 T7SS effector LXG polymorphic toxin [Bacillus thuringiensis]WPU72773.1 T7SS effector LXG polymorphic toxin [Bacillus sp. RA(2023)]